MFYRGICNADTLQTGKIARIVVEGNQTVSVWMENQPTNNECLSDGHWVIEFQNDSLAKEKYSAILAAAASKQVVGFYFMTSLWCGVFGAKNILRRLKLLNDNSKYAITNIFCF